MPLTVHCPNHISPLPHTPGAAMILIFYDSGLFLMLKMLLHLCYPQTHFLGVHPGRFARGPGLRRGPCSWGLILFGRPLEIRNYFILQFVL